MNEEPIKKGQNRLKKEAVVAEISEKIAKSKALVFANYQGLTHLQIEDLKKKLKPAEAELAVTKNTLLKIALKDNGLTVDDEKYLENATATIFIYNDVVAPLKELAKVIKELNLPDVKFGILEKKNISKDDVIKLATLPSREVLIAQVVGGMKTPIYGLHRSLVWNLQKFVMTLGAIAKGKPAGQTPSATPEPTVAATTEEKVESPSKTAEAEPAAEATQGEEATTEAQAQEQTPVETQTEEPKESEGGEN